VLARLRPLVPMLLLAACLGSGPGAAALNTAVAVGYTANERAHGRGCWAACPHGTTCNEDTGYCDPLPCGGCPTGQECRQTPVGDRCVLPGAEAELTIWTTVPGADAGVADAGPADAGPTDARAAP
jgi:hypothetical protein